jgi:hypothetical protein
VREENDIAMQMLSVARGSGGGFSRVWGAFTDNGNRVGGSRVRALLPQMILFATAVELV